MEVIIPSLLLWGETQRKSEEGIQGYKATTSCLSIYNFRIFAPEVEQNWLKSAIYT